MYAGRATHPVFVALRAVGAVPNGGIVERDTSVDLHDFKIVSLLLRNPDFTTAKQIADVINQEFQKPVASAIDSARVDVDIAQAAAPSTPELISRVQNLAVKCNYAGKDRDQRTNRNHRSRGRREADAGLRHSRKSLHRGGYYVRGSARSQCLRSNLRMTMGRLRGGSAPAGAGGSRNPGRANDDSRRVKRRAPVQELP